METEKFEKEIREMEKPVVSHLKHEDLLADAIINAKGKTVVSWWWISIPLFVMAMLLMKSAYNPGTTFLSGIQELKSTDRYISLLVFLISPFIIIIVNALTIRNIYLLSGKPKSFSFSEEIWFSVVNIALAIFIIIIYVL
jgi:hypothetical protein